MAEIVREVFAYRALAANSGTQLIGVGDAATTLGGFLCTTAGTMQINEGAGAGAAIVANVAVVAGTYYPVPCSAPLGAFCQLGGGAAGTFFVGQ